MEEYRLKNGQQWQAAGGGALQALLHHVAAIAGVARVGTIHDLDGLVGARRVGGVDWRMAAGREES